MQILMVHNEYGKRSGEEVMISRIVDLLRAHHHKVSTYFRSSTEIRTVTDKLGAFFSGVYSSTSRSQMRQIIARSRPDIIQVQNVFPLLSPSVLIEAKEQGVPVVMRCANFRLLCPNGLFLTKGTTCEKCAGGREWWCIINNCEANRLKSCAYALRNYVARVRRYFLDNVTYFYAQTRFQRQKLVNNGFPPDRVAVIPNYVGPSSINVSDTVGDYVTQVGRVSREKGVETLLEAAAICHAIRFRIVGHGADTLRSPYLHLPNVELRGHVTAQELNDVYANARVVVLASICYEGFPSVLLEAMLNAKPVICSRIGGLPEVVDDGVTGLLFEPGNAEDLAEKIQCLWDRPDLCRQMGQAGREKALGEYSPEKYYTRLMTAYKRAIDMASSGAQ